jgi:hypothetical protein
MKRTILFAITIVLALSIAGCVTTPTATPTPTPTPTIVPTPTPIVTAPANITVTLPPGQSAGTITIQHYIHGTITFNHQPTSNYYVLIDTDKGNEYGNNSTITNGNFNVSFMDDGSTLYWIKIVDTGGNIIYKDSQPRYLNNTAPMNISVEVPATNQIIVTVTPGNQ